MANGLILYETSFVNTIGTVTLFGTRIVGIRTVTTLAMRTVTATSLSIMASLLKIHQFCGIGGRENPC